MTRPKLKPISRSNLRQVSIQHIADFPMSEFSSPRGVGAKARGCLVGMDASSKELD